MTISQTYSFSPSVSDILLGALRILRVVQEGQDPSPYMMANARQALEFVIKRMSIDRVPIWTRYTIIVPIVPGRNPYTVGSGLNINIGPSGTVGPTKTPVNIFRVNYKYSLDGQEVKLEPLGRQDYLDYALKSSSGVPNSWYFEKYPDNGNLYLYPVPDSTNTGDYLIMDVQRYIYDAGVDTNTLDMPLEFNHYLKWAVAEELLCEYEQPKQREDRISAKSRELYEIVCMSNGDTASIYFQPDTRWEYPQ
jgi:hypothetical protein